MWKLWCLEAESQRGEKKGFFLLSFNFVNAVLLHSLRSQTGLYVPPRDPIFKFSFANLSLDSDTCHFALLILQVFVRNFFFFKLKEYAGKSYI